MHRPDRRNLTGLSTGGPAGPSGQVLTAADCAAVTAMAAAVELRTDPAEQCNFQPLLKPGEPDLCTGQKNPPVVYEENFEDGLAGWTLSNQGVYAGWPGLNWQATRRCRAAARGRRRSAPTRTSATATRGQGTSRASCS